MHQSLNKAETKKNKKQAQLAQKNLKKDIRERARMSEQLRKMHDRDIRENWFKLDNAALIYPAISSTNWNSVFRLSVITKQAVDPDKLQIALDDTLKRYPFFNVALREGVFWHYFQVLDKRLLIEKEKTYPCQAFAFNNRAQVFRVLYMDHKISFETFHSLTDGGGATRFFNTLIIRYFELCGAVFSDISSFDCNSRDLPSLEENEDSFKRVATKQKPRSRGEKSAYQVKGNIEPVQKLRTVTGLVSVGALKEVAHKYNATINEFLTAVYFGALLLDKKYKNIQQKYPIKISVPVNMRRFFASSTLRNFSQFVNMELPIEMENGSFEEIIARVKEESKNFNIDYLQGSINANVNSEKNIFVRLMPLSIKNFALKLIYNRVGERQFTSTLTNIGQIKLPAKVSEYIEHYFMVLGATKLNKINLTALSYGDECALTFSTRLTETAIIRNFFQKLTSFGISAKVFSNY